MTKPTGTRAPTERNATQGPALDDHAIGDEALHFTRWFMKSKYHMMGGFVGELTQVPGARDADRLRSRFSRTLQHAFRVHQVRGIVTLFLALGVLAAAASSIGRLLEIAIPEVWLEVATTISASASVLLVALRLLLDRYLERCDVAATFLAIELSAASRERSLGPRA